MDTRKNLIKEIIREEAIKRFRERGLKCELSQDSDLVVKSGEVKVGVVFILSPDEDIDTISDKIRNFASFGTQIYVFIEKHREKEIASQTMAKGLAGKLKFVSWELRFYGI